MTIWNFLPAEHPIDPDAPANGARVARLGTVSFVRSVSAGIRWDDGLVTEEWLAELVAAR